MSSQTPNLNLVLPVGTENVSRQIINDNNTKIDTAVGDNSDAIANLGSHFIQSAFNYRSYSTWQGAMSANKSTLLPENGTFTFGFLTDGGAPHIFTLIKDGNYINGYHQVYNGYDEAIYSTDGGTTWTVKSLKNDKVNYISAFSVDSGDSKTDNVSAGSTATYTILHDGIYRLYIQTNTNASNGQSCSITSGGNAILSMRTNGIQYQNAQVFAPLRAGIVLTINAPAGSAVQYQITRYTES